jgi:CysZ protein
MIEQLVPSPLYIIRGAIFVWSHKVLWKYAAAPVMISVVILVGSYILLYDLFIKWISPYSQEWYGQIVYYVFLLLITVALLGLSLFIVTRLASAIAAPFNDVISRKAEEIAAGILHEAPFSLPTLLRDSGRLFVHSFRLLGLYMLLLMLGLILFLIPVIGGALYTCFGVLISAYMFGYEYLGYPMDRRRFSWPQKQKFMRSKFSSVLGFGLGNVAVAAIPIVNFFFIPAAVVGGTLLFLDITNESKK